MKTATTFSEQSANPNFQACLRFFKTFVEHANGMLFYSATCKNSRKSMRPSCINDLVLPVICLRQGRRVTSRVPYFRSRRSLLWRSTENKLMRQLPNNPILQRDVRNQPTRSWLFTPATRPERFGKAKEAGRCLPAVPPVTGRPRAPLR